jgi:hypothetical protein
MRTLLVKSHPPPAARFVAFVPLSRGAAESLVGRLACRHGGAQGPANVAAPPTSGGAVAGAGACSAGPAWDAAAEQAGGPRTPGSAQAGLTGARAPGRAGGGAAPGTRCRPAPSRHEPARASQPRRGRREPRPRHPWACPDAAAPGGARAGRRRLPALARAPRGAPALRPCPRPACGQSPPVARVRLAETARARVCARRGSAGPGPGGGGQLASDGDPAG